MGKGKGEPEYWAAVVRPGTVLYEIGGVTEEAARICFARLAHKMPVRVRFIRRRTPVATRCIQRNCDEPFARQSDRADE